MKWIALFCFRSFIVESLSNSTSEEKIKEFLEFVRQVSSSGNDFFEIKNIPNSRNEAKAKLASVIPEAFASILSPENSTAGTARLVNLMLFFLKFSHARCWRLISFKIRRSISTCYLICTIVPWKFYWRCDWVLDWEIYIRI